MKTFPLLLVLFIIALPVLSQDAVQPGLQRHTWDVFVQPSAENNAHSNLIFINLLSGEQTALSAAGERFTLTSNGVIYFDRQARQVKLAKADGIIRDHPFIKATDETHRVDWIVSQDGEQIVWTISHIVEDGQLITATWLADAPGTEIRELLVYGPRDGIRLLPIAFGDDQSEIYMEVHTDGSDGLSSYTRRTGLFALVISENELLTHALPGDQTCFCAVGFGADRMLRLAPNREAGGLDVEVYPLASGDRQIIPALSRGNYREGGNILLNADGTQAIYALSQIRESAAEQARIRTVLVHVDISNGRQRIASSPITGMARPLGFTDEDRAVLFTAGPNDVTFKLDLEGGALVVAADAVYLGQLGDH